MHKTSFVFRWFRQKTELHILWFYMWLPYFGVHKCNLVLLNSIRILRFEEAYNDEQSVALVDDMVLQAPILGQGYAFTLHSNLLYICLCVCVYISSIYFSFDEIRIVGEVASSGNHQWLFSDTLFQVCSLLFSWCLIFLIYEL